MMFAVRMVNPADGPLGEHPGWNGVALPGLQADHSPLLSAMILAPLVTIWHVPLFFLEEGDLLHGVQSINLAYHIPNPLPNRSVRIPNCLLWGALREHRGSSPWRNHPLNCRGRGPTRAP